jgi:hypothetical protein
MKWIACAVAALVALSVAYADDEIKGEVTALDSAAGILEISGVKINAKDAVVKNVMDKHCALTDLKVGDSVDIEGTFSGPAEMTAREIEKELMVTDEVKGTLAAVDAAARTLTISGITVKVPQSARLEGDEDVAIQFGQITAGTHAECEGKWTGSKELTASKIDVD